MSHFLSNQEKEMILHHIKSLVQIDSVFDATTIQKNQPFGYKIRCAMDQFLKIASDWGFRVKDFDGYACHAEIGPQSDDYIGVLAHLDVVDAGDQALWHCPRYDLTIQDGLMYGRGVNDDKGPLIGALYAAKLASERNELVYPIRVIVGGAEETTWQCMEHYFKVEKQPLMAFSPDGNFPIVNGEKGILQCQCTFPSGQHYRLHSEKQTMYNCYQLWVNSKLYQSDQLKSRNPQRGSHAVFDWLNENPILKNEPGLEFINDFLLNDVVGKRLAIDSHHPEMGESSVCIMSLNTDKDQLTLTLDIRYPISTNASEIIKTLDMKIKPYGGHLEVIRNREPLYVSKDSALIKILAESYQEVMNEKANTITKGGASYARVLKCGVAFGPTFEGEETHPHLPNECMKLETLWKAMEIYTSALGKLAGLSQ